MVAVLASRVFSVSNDNSLPMLVNICPTDPTYFRPPHSFRHRETNDPADRNLLPVVCIKIFDDGIQLILSGPTVTLGAAANKPETTECHSCKGDVLLRDINPVNRCRVRNYSIDLGKLSSDGNRTNSLPGTELSIFNQLFTMQLVER